MAQSYPFGIHQSSGFEISGRGIRLSDPQRSAGRSLSADLTPGEFGDVRVVIFLGRIVSDFPRRKSLRPLRSQRSRYRRFTAETPPNAEPRRGTQKDSFSEYGAARD